MHAPLMSPLQYPPMPHQMCNSELNAWTDTPLGRALIEEEQRQIEPLLSKLYGPTAIQLGIAGFCGFIQASSSVHQIVAVEHPIHRELPGVALNAAPEAMPFDARSANVMLLPHVLEFSADPHQVLREASRVLVPEGHLVLIGFNPFSLWGGRRTLGRLWDEAPPWSARFYTLARVKEWLSVLGFDVVSGTAACYLPPMKSTRVRDKLLFMRKAGARWWPMCAAVYILVARKREIGMTLISPRWRRTRRLAPGLVGRVSRHG